MPKTKFQEVIFTIMMVFVMVYAMICYNIALNIGGMSNKVFLSAFHASSRGFDGNEEKLELVKKLREMGKDAVKKINRQYFFTSPEALGNEAGMIGAASLL